MKTLFKLMHANISVHQSSAQFLYPINSKLCFHILLADPPEYNKMYAIPGLTFIGAYGAAAQTGLYPEVHQAAYLGAGLCCIGALTGLSSQSTARVGQCVMLIHSL